MDNFLIKPDRVIPNPLQRKNSWIWLLAVCLLLTHGLPTRGNDKQKNFRIPLSMQNVLLEDVLQEIEKQSKLTFSFYNEHIDLNSRVSVELKNASLDETLRKVFPNSAIRYEVRGQQIILAPAKSDRGQVERNTGVYLEENMLSASRIGGGISSSP